MTVLKWPTSVETMKRLKNSRLYIVELDCIEMAWYNFISGLDNWQVEMRFGLDSLFLQMLHFVFFW